MKTAIRLDDITPDMDPEKYKKVEKILDDNGICPLIGVVPFNEDENLKRSSERLTDSEFAEYIKGRLDKKWVVALHGYNHVYTTGKMGIFPLNNFSEYAGVPYEKQLEMLKKGKDKLAEFGVQTDIFMTPAHTYDKNTLKALVDAGFSRVTDGFGSGPYIRKGLTFYPISRKRKECISDKKGYTTLVLHTNTMEDSDIERFENMIRDNREHFINYCDYLEVEAVSRGALGNITEYFTALAKYFVVKLL
ncbi:MAG: DUF2334 domain-containing protein [Lachnospiraceae bacterium]|nr:DUF2334 domain-containing protein [Candidatus Colinaster scatohippi]